MITGFWNARETHQPVCYNMRALKEGQERTDELHGIRRPAMKIVDVKIEVVRRTLPDTGLDSDLGRFRGDVEQGVLRILTDR